MLSDYQVKSIRLSWAHDFFNVIYSISLINHLYALSSFSKPFYRNAIPEPGSDNHAAFMDSKIMEESGKSSTKQSSTTKAPKEEL